MEALLDIELGKYNGYSFSMFTSAASLNGWPILNVWFYPQGRKFVNRMVIHPIARVNIEYGVLQEFLMVETFEAYIKLEKKELSKRIDNLFNTEWDKYLNKVIGNLTINDARNQFDITLGDILKKSLTNKPWNVNI